jgi:phosphotransferase system HPr (HPr) family protein
MTERSVVAARALHARPASELVAAAGRYAADVTLVRGDREANAKSIISVLALDVGAGTELIVRADGPDAEAAVAALAEAVGGG